MNEEKLPRCKSCSKEPADRIAVSRMLTKLDACFRSNDLKAAGETLEWWEKTARELGDDRGLISVRNEELGFYRRTNEKEKAMAAVEEVLWLLDATGTADTVSGATVYLNAATTLKAFGRAADGISLYEKAQALYRRGNMENTFEYAALLNNKATALCDSGSTVEAEACYQNAIAVLQKQGGHDAEIALSLVGLCHLWYQRDDQAASDRIEATLDKAWEVLNSPGQPHDANYAFCISKLAPSFLYFHRDLEAKALEDTAKEIYEQE